jgi:hypothetical protein
MDGRISLDIWDEGRRERVEVPQWQPGQQLFSLDFTAITERTLKTKGE